MFRCRLSTLLLLVMLAALGLTMVAEYHQAARRTAEHFAAEGRWWESFDQEESFIAKVSRWW